MKQSKGFLLAAITLSALFFLAVISGGCGGSSGGDVSTAPQTQQTPQTSSSRCVLIGDITTPRYDSSDLTPYVRKRITETASFADPEVLFYTLDGLTSRDFLFLGNIADSSFDVNNIGQGLAFLGGLAVAYQHGVAIVLVYPDSADVQTMNELLNLSLAEPEEDAPYKNFELLGTAVRELPGDNKHIFTYVATCDGNRDYFSSLISRDNTEAESADSSVAAVNTAPAVKASAEELYNELCELRVQKLFDWAEGLDARAKEMGASISGAVDKLIHDAALENELLTIAQGITTDHDDTFSMIFYSLSDAYPNYFKTYLKGNRQAQDFIKKLGLNYYDHLVSYSAYVKRETNSKYRVISLHSFDTHRDYYLVIAQSITQPRALAITNKYARPAVLGYTKALWPYLWLSIGGNHLERYLPDQTVNQSRSYTDSNGWTATRAISTTDSIESSASGEVGSEGAKVGGGVTAGHSVTYSYESTLSHTSETTWTAQDYEIIPKPYNDKSSKRYAKWVLDVATPTFAASNPNMAVGDWQISTAARSSVTSNTEAIFWVGLNEADTVKLYGATDWEEGFSGFEPGVGHAHTSVYHEGKHVELNFTRPLHTALINATNEGSRDNVLYTATLLSEANWTAESDSDWITLSSSSKSGKAGSSTIRYEVSENTTGKMREGTITITSGRDKVFIPFTQSGGRYINDK